MSNRLFKCVKDLQGGTFGVDRCMTADGWAEQAYEWACQDGWEEEELKSTDLEWYKERHPNYTEEMIEDELMNFIRDVWDLEIIEVFQLDDNQWQEFVDEMSASDICGLTYLADIVENSDKATEELKDLVCSVISLNYMNDCVETKDYRSYLEHDYAITELYRTMRNELFNLINVSIEDVYGEA